MTKISASIVADSICNGHRITTMKVTMPRMILAEAKTHRVMKRTDGGLEIYDIPGIGFNDDEMLSRNSASSRAIPFEKMLESVRADPFIPIAWQADHKGMQGSQYITDPKAIEIRRGQWLQAMDRCCSSAWALHNTYSNSDFEEAIPGVTKQLCNRLLEPFMWHTVLVTATEWENFFQLRYPQYQIGQSPVFGSRKDCLEYFSDDPDLYQTLSQNTEVEWLQINKGQAEIHMMALAEAMWDARNESTPRELQPGQWHIPFYTDEMWSKVADLDMSASFEAREKSLIQIATAKAAQTSYTIVGEDGKETPYSKLIDLHDRLLASGHMSPFEHCAQAMTYNEFQENVKGVGRMVPSEAGFDTDNLGFSNEAHGWCHNLRGWRSYRSMIPNEKREARKHLELFSRVLPPKTEDTKPLEAGDFVHYFLESDFGKVYENGRIKYIDESDASVVYKCNNNWEGYMNYTGQRTVPSRLAPGWVDKYGKPIDTPKI